VKVSLRRLGFEWISGGEDAAQNRGLPLPHLSNGYRDRTSRTEERADLEIDRYG